MSAPAEPVPDLVFYGPSCPVCPDAREAHCDGTSWWCEGCGCTWAIDGSAGEAPRDEAQEDEEVQA